MGDSLVSKPMSVWNDTLQSSKGETGVECADFES